MTKREIREAVDKSLKRRYLLEHCFRWMGRLAVVFSLACVLVLFTDIFSKGYTAFLQTQVRLELDLSYDSLGVSTTPSAAEIADIDFDKVLRDSIYDRFPEVTDRRQKRMLRGFYSSGAAYEIREAVLRNEKLIGQKSQFWITADDDVDMFVKGRISRETPEQNRRFKDNQIGWLDDFAVAGDLRKRWNTNFFTSGNSREPEQSGIASALVGSLLTMIVTLILSLPIGMAAAIYLEEMAPKNRLTEIIEVNINNLAAVPSIIFGLLGLAIYINFFGLPRSAPLVGGLVLTLMTLPTIILSSRAALKAVPPSIREAALGMGASKTQVVFHHVLPLALPGMLTGAIIGMAQALGETAPLLMIGMVAFIVDLPSGFTDAATVLPVQIFLWADSPERAFLERTSAAIMVLLMFLIAMNALAVLLRRKLEKRW